MARTLEEITNDALALPQQEQMRLARVLLDLNEPPDPDAEAAWEHEIQRRIDQIDSGTAKGLTVADVLRDLDRKLRR